MYGKEILELKDVRQMLQNNELMKKTDSIEEASALVAKGQRGYQRVGNSKGIQKHLAILLTIFQEIRAHQEELYEI